MSRRFSFPQGLTVALALAVLAAGAALRPATAQTVTADQIIAKLRPKSAADLSGATRGIRLLAPNATVPGAATAAPPAAATGAVDLTINFESGSAILSSHSEAQLAELGKALTSPALQADRIRIEGHTDTVGTDAYNLRLSQLRAEAVASYLQEHFSITAARLQAVGMGKAGLLVATQDQVAEPRNRRVHVVDLGSGSGA